MKRENESLTATIVITTKDRRDELRAALQSCMSQNHEIEVVVVDDASTDGTAEMVAREFPTVKTIRHEKATGYIVGRNEAARCASGDIIFSIDDDAAFSTGNVVEQTLNEFDRPHIGAVAIPYMDVNKDDVERQRSPDNSQVFVTDRFIGTAHALRRELFLSLGGYSEFFFHQGEEGDYCARMLNAGYVVRLGSADLIHHYESPKRDTRRMDLYGRRNDLLFAWVNVPWMNLPVHLAAVSFNGVRFGLRIGHPVRMLRGVLFGYASIIRHLCKRNAISKPTYRTLRKLRKIGCMPIRDVL